MVLHGLASKSPSNLVKFVPSGGLPKLGYIFGSVIGLYQNSFPTDIDNRTNHSEHYESVADPAVEKLEMRMV